MKIYIAFVFTVLVTLCAGAEWNYDEQGEDWATANGYTKCAGKSQSPVNIQDPECDQKLNKSISFTDYDKSGSNKFQMQNNGHTLVLDLSSTGAEIDLGTKATYKLEQMHFHWGSNNEKGSEHLLMGKAFPNELHMVHFNKKYGTIGRAVNESDGLAVLGVFIKEGSENPTFKKFLRNVSNVMYAGNTTEVDPFKMEDLLPENKDVFYRYSGSLTTPTCDQSVTWTVYDDPISISKEQLNQFRSLKDSKNKPLVNNYRAVQELNGRVITYWNEEKCPSGAAALGASVFSVIFFLLFTLF